jgi:hypothetical protein
MPRLKSAVSGVTVQVSDETAALIGSEWAAADDAKPSSSKKSE